MTTALPDVARLIVRTPNWLGDTVMALPAMAAMRAAFANRTLIVAAPPAIAPLFHEATAVAPDEIVSVEKGTEAATLARVGADAAVLFPNSFRTAWVCRQAGVKQRWGYGTSGRSLLLTRAVSRPGRVHQADYYRLLVEGLGVAVAEALPRFAVTTATQARAARMLERAGLQPRTPLVGIAPGAAYGHAKRWPAPRFAALIAHLSAGGVSSVLVGAESDRAAGREIESALPAGITLVNLIGRTDLRLFAALLAACHVFVSNDSGAMHLAAAAGVPVAAIFGPTDERVTAPLGDHDVIVHPVFCRPCLLRECPIDHRCMRGISVEAVATAVAARLEARVAPQAERPA